MNSANRTTITMMLLSAVSVVVAMYYYPWPEFASVDAEVGKPLFEAYEAKDVRGIDVIRFNSDKSSLDRIKLVRRGERWGIPARQNFRASNTEQVGYAINCLNDRTVFEVISENQEDHIKYGVVDPAEFTVEKNVAALGQKLTLTDRNNQKIADLIVGSVVKNDSKKRYVRIPGKPRVYVIDFDGQSLSTDFFRWVSPDLLNLRTAGEDRRLREIAIDNYQIQSTENEEKPARKSIYRASLVPAGGRLNVKSLEIPQGDGDNWKRLSLTPEQQVKLTSMAPLVIQMIVDDVRRKPDDLSEAIQFPEDDVADSVFAKLPSYGFYPAGKQNGDWTFDAANGQVSVTTMDGVQTNILIGQFGSENSFGGGKLNYYLMINATVDAELLRRPERPAGVKNDDSDENKAYLRLVEQWKSAVDKARQSSRELNAVHADWFYLVSQDIALRLTPDIPIPTVIQEAAEKTENADAEASTDTPPATNSTPKTTMDTGPESDSGEESDKSVKDGK